MLRHHSDTPEDVRDIVEHALAKMPSSRKRAEVRRRLDAEDRRRPGGTGTAGTGGFSVHV